MAERTEINCIKITEKNGVITGISQIGGTDKSGRRWRLSAEDAISIIEAGNREFYIRIDEHMFFVHVGEAKGRKWLRTHWDLSKPDYLLRLPTCIDPEPGK